MNIIKDIANLTENVGIVIVELLAPPVVDDIVEHELHDFKKIFVKDFSKEKSFTESCKDFCDDIVKNIKKDFKLIKSISCFHPRHGKVLKEFVERSLIKNGFETAVSAGLVAVVGIESLPVLVAGVVAEQVIENLEEKYEPTIKDKIHNLREKIFGKKESNSLKP